MLFNEVGSGGGRGDFKTECVKWIKENGNKYTLNRNFMAATTSDDTSAFQNIYFLYIETMGGEEVVWIPWVYSDSTGVSILNDATYFLQIGIEVKINSGAVYDIHLTNIAASLDEDLIIYVFPEIELHIMS